MLPFVKVVASVAPVTWIRGLSIHAAAYAHSMVLRDHNRQLYQRKTSRPSAKTRFSDPSEIRAFDFKGEFRRSAIYPVSTTIGINRPIFKGGYKVIVLDSSKKSVGLRGASPHPGVHFGRISRSAGSVSKTDSASRSHQSDRVIAFIDLE